MRTCVRIHPRDRVQEALDLARSGRTATEVSRLTGLPRSTVREWLSGSVPRSAGDGSANGACSVCRQPGHDFAGLPRDYLYLLGLYLGDGCISVHPRGVYKLRIFLDAAYPGIVEECAGAIRTLRPANKVALLAHRGHFENSSDSSTVEVIAYSRGWPCLFPQHGPGRKHERSIVLLDWQRQLLETHPEPLLRGLIHSDGCRFMNTGRGNWRHPRYSFSNASADIRRIFCDACDALEVRWTTAPHTVYVSRMADVARLDEFIGAKA